MLTAVPLIWAITTVVIAITLPADRNAAVVVTSEISQRITGNSLCLKGVINDKAFRQVWTTDALNASICPLGWKNTIYLAAICCSWKFVTTNNGQLLTASLLVTVVDAVIGSITAGPLRDTAVVCCAGEFSVITLVIRTHWTGQEMFNTFLVLSNKREKWFSCNDGAFCDLFNPLTFCW